MILPAGLQRLVVTGATGWLGRVALSLARRHWGTAAEDHLLAYGSTVGRVELLDGGFPVSPLAELPGTDLRGAAVLHFAFVTKDRLGDSSDAAFVARNLEIDEMVVAAVRRSRPAGLFVASSGMARQVQDGGGDLYGVMKLMQEQKFTLLRAELEIPVLIGRIWSLAGPYINKPEAYALAAFLLQARREGKITVKAALPVYRAYLHVEDLVTVILASLVQPGQAPASVIDLAGPEIVEMSDLALAAARAVGLDDDVIERGPVSFARRSAYFGDPTPFRDLALAVGLRPRSFTRQVAETLRYLDETGAA